MGLVTQLFVIMDGLMHGKPMTLTIQLLAQVDLKLI